MNTAVIMSQLAGWTSVLYSAFTCTQLGLAVHGAGHIQSILCLQNEAQHHDKQQLSELRLKSAHCWCYHKVIVATLVVQSLDYAELCRTITRLTRTLVVQ